MIINIRKSISVSKSEPVRNARQIKYKVAYVSLREVESGTSLSSALNNVLKDFPINELELCLDFLNSKEEDRNIREIDMTLRSVKRIRYLGTTMIFDADKVAQVLSKLPAIEVLQVETIRRKSVNLLLKLNKLRNLSIPWNSRHSMNRRGSAARPMIGNDTLVSLRKICNVLKYLKVEKVQLTGVTEVTPNFIKIFGVLVDAVTRDASCKLMADIRFMAAMLKYGGNILVLSKLCKRLHFGGLNVPSLFTRQYYKNVVTGLIRKEIVSAPLISAHSYELTKVELTYVQNLLAK